MKLVYESQKPVACLGVCRPCTVGQVKMAENPYQVIDRTLDTKFIDNKLCTAVEVGSRAKAIVEVRSRSVLFSASRIVRPEI